MPRLQGEFEQRRAGQQHDAADGMVGEPGMRGQRQPTGKDETVTVSELHSGAQQWMVRCLQPGGRDVAEACLGRQPVVLVLEGVGGEVGVVAGGVVGSVGGGGCARWWGCGRGR